MFIACLNGLKGFPDAIQALFPKTAVQLCLVHMVRHSLNFEGWKQRRSVLGFAINHHSGDRELGPAQARRVRG
jgi:transposase-like protein